MPTQPTLEHLLTRFKRFRSGPPTSASQAEQTALAQIANLVRHVFFQEDRSLSQSSSKIIALTASVAGEGTSTISSLMALELSRSSQLRSLLISTDVLERLQASHLDTPETSWKQTAQNGFWIPAPALTDRGRGTQGPWRIDLAFRRRVIEALRSQFDNVVIDCRSVRNSSDVAVLAQWVDGFVLVIRADSTTRFELEQSIQNIQAAGGDLKGCCFNRRTYPVPERLYRFLKRSR